ncbi:MAG: hypothetical protein H6707_04210 [Deltaproteobacteria bacterium]|nr:hypothetical protein [Deltaproteobacteria bacterium]
MRALWLAVSLLMVLVGTGWAKTHTFSVKQTNQSKNQVGVKFYDMQRDRLGIGPAFRFMIDTLANKATPSLILHVQSKHKIRDLETREQDPATAAFSQVRAGDTIGLVVLCPTSAHSNLDPNKLVADGQAHCLWVTSAKGNPSDHSNVLVKNAPALDHQGNPTWVTALETEFKVTPQMVAEGGFNLYFTPKSSWSQHGLPGGNSLGVGGFDYGRTFRAVFE